MCMWNGITGGLRERTDASCTILEETLKRPTTKPESAPAKPKATADRTLHIEWPWSMTWMEYVDEMLEFLKTQIGPRHRLFQPEESLWRQVHAQVRNPPGLGRRAATVCCGSQASEEQAVVLASILLDRVNFTEPCACAS